MDLPDWNEALREEDGFDCSPVKQPLAQVTLKNGNTLRVSELARPGAAATTGNKPDLSASPAAASHPGPNNSDIENDNAASPAALEAAPTPEAPRSMRRTHTPNRTGLTGKAVRLPSRLGQTPGAKKQEPFVVPQSTQAGRQVSAAQPAAGGGGGGGLKSILKRLNFSTTKAKAAAAVVAPRAPAPVASAAAQPQSTIKQLRFDAGTTPAAATAAQPPNSRHVTFDAATVSPAPRSRLVAAAAPAWRTPQPAIQEEDSSSDEPVVGGSVNSSHAGSTPYDRRLSSLFRKYQEAGTPELPDAELDDLLVEGAVRSPSWKRLSSASVPESICELSKRYNGRSSNDSVLSSLPASPALAAAALLSAGQEGHAAAAMESEAATPMRLPVDCEGGSPAMDPTPHHVLDSVMKRNALYESPPVEVGPGTADAVLCSQQQQGAAAVSSAAAGGTKPTEATGGHQLSPESVVAELLAPVLVATMQQIESDKAAQQQGAHAAPGAAVAAALSPDGRPSSPAELLGFPHLGAEAATPGGSGARSASDGVPRDSDGIPTVTPCTVTVRRGGYCSGLTAVLEEEDDLAANLFPSFSPGESEGVGGCSFSPAQLLQCDGSNASIVQLAAEAGGAPAQEEQAPAAGTTPGAAPGQEAGSPEFSFFPASHKQTASASAAGATPELQAVHGAGGAGSTISPEILGFYESQAQAQQQTSASTGQAGGAPALPKSIIKCGRALTEAGTPVLGHAQRGGPREGAPPTITRELQALMADLRLEDPADIQQMGTVSALSPVRATGSLMRGFLGGLAKAITPVRRSARKLAVAPSRPLEAMLEEAEFSYVPNAALMSEDAEPKREEAKARAARKAASQATAAATARQAAEPSLMPTGMATEDEGHAQVCNEAAANRRYSTRSALKAAKAEKQGDNDLAAAEAAGTPSSMELDVDPAAERRFSLRRLRTPKQKQQAHNIVDEAATPQAAVPAADIPVAQDASPSFYDAAAAANDARRSYSLRTSTLKKSRKKAGAPGAAGVDSGDDSKEQRASPQPHLSPTEQGIRASLRRSARKGQAHK